MTKKILEKLKRKLEKQKISIERELKTFAKESEKLKEGWESLFPFFDGETGSASLEKAADEVEEYEARLPVEYILEKKLRNINLALEKIKKAAKGEPRQRWGKYGICEKCQKPIILKRLLISPEVRFCIKCQKIKG